jgi:hypothetical protein
MALLMLVQSTVVHSYSGFRVWVRRGCGDRHT